MLSEVSYLNVQYARIFSMRIAFISSASMNSSGGDGRVARELAEALSEENEVMLVLSGKKTGIHKMGNNLTRFEVSGKKKGDVILPVLNPVKINSLFKNLRKFSPEVIHFHDQGPVAFVVLLWALKNNIPTVFTSHTIPSEVVSFGLVELFPKIQSFFDNKIFDSYFDLFLKKSSAIVAINDSVMEDLSNYELNTPVYKIPNGRNLKHYNGVSFPDITKRPVKMIFVGYLNKRKNQAFLIDAMKHVPFDDYELNLAGVSLNGSYEENLKSKVEELGVNVNFLGKVSHERIPVLLEESHFFVSASLMEVQSLAILEALASGTPVISLDNETTSEFVDESIGFNFPSEVDAEAFADKIKELAGSSPEVYGKMCEKAREKVNNLDWKNVADQTSAMYVAVVGNNRYEKKGLNGLRKLFESVDMGLFE